MGAPLTPDLTAAGGVERRAAGREMAPRWMDAALLSIKVTASTQAVAGVIAELPNDCTGGGLEEPAELARSRTVNKQQDHPLQAACAGPNHEGGNE